MYNLQARNVLGLYYRETGQLDSSDYYFRSMLECKDRVKQRPMFDCIALSNLASNYRLRGRYREAITLHAAALPASLAEGDHSFTSGIYVGLADCYLELGRPDSCKAMIDSALYHIRQWPWVMSYRSCDLYPVMARYYARIGDREHSIAYMDSTTVANRRQDEKYSGLLVLRAKQELFESERARKEAQLVTFRHVSVIMSVTAGVIFVVLLVISVLYRKKHQAYRRLVACSREWAEQVPAVVPPAEADATDRILMENLGRLIDEEQIYLDPDLDLETLSQRMGVHRNMISKAVNTVHGKPFSAYINECRVRQAILLLSDPANDNLSLETIAFDSGFSTRQTFYRAFKAQTGLNPATFRKNRG
ncbi:helix-turn-helix domain-containing protein [Parabacteroides faecis]